MIELKTGDLLAEDAEALVNSVNCVGVMGRGIALQFKKAFPGNFKDYKQACDRGEVLPGKMHIFETEGLGNPKYIFNFPTKRHWKGASRIEDIESGLQNLREEILKRKIKSVAIPPLGSGLGGQNWKDIKELIKNEFSQLEGVRLIIFEPTKEPNPKNKYRDKKIPNMTIVRASLLNLASRYLEGLLDPEITLLEIHKLMYLLQEAGENLRLKFSKGRFGPYAEKLSHVLNAIEGYYVYGYKDGGDRPGKELRFVPGATKDAKAFLEDSPETIKRINQVSELIEGFETQLGLELLATVRWIMSNKGICSNEELFKEFYRWSPQKMKFTERQIIIAAEHLVEKGWSNTLPRE